MLLTILTNIAILVIVGIAIWGIIPYDFKQKDDKIMGVIIEIAWCIIWFYIFLLGGHTLIFV